MFAKKVGNFQFCKDVLSSLSENTGTESIIKIHKEPDLMNRIKTILYSIPAESETPS